eukprot:10972818-Prorocentrum_lima.AAC.1
MRIHGFRSALRKSRIRIVGPILAGSQRNHTMDCPNEWELLIHTGFRSGRGNPLRFSPAPS